MTTLLALKYIATALAGYGVGRYYGRPPADKKDESQEKDK